MNVGLIIFFSCLNEALLPKAALKNSTNTSCAMILTGTIYPLHQSSAGRISVVRSYLKTLWKSRPDKMQYDMLRQSDLRICLEFAELIGPVYDTFFPYNNTDVTFSRLGLL